MVKLYSVVLMVYKQNNTPDIIYSSFELSDFGFFKRPTIKELCVFASVESIKRSSIGQRTSLEHQSLMCYTHILDSGFAASCVTDLEYPSRIAYDFLFQVLKKYLDTKSESDIDMLLQSYQDVNKIDKISAIKNEINETTKICNDTINKLLIREDELHDLLQKTEHLSEQTKLFLDESKKLNSCC